MLLIIQLCILFTAKLLRPMNKKQWHMNWTKEWYFITSRKSDTRWNESPFCLLTALVWARVALIFFTVANTVLETALVIQGYFRYPREAKGFSAPHLTPPAKGPRVHRSCEGTQQGQLIPTDPFQSKGSWRRKVSHSDSCHCLPHPTEGRERGSEQLWSLSCCLGLDSTSS